MERYSIRLSKTPEHSARYFPVSFPRRWSSYSIVEQADQSCQDSSRIRAIKGVEQFAYLLGGTLGHDDELSKRATPNQFGKRRIDAKCADGCRLRGNGFFYTVDDIAVCE